MADTSAITRKLGPLPVWAWGILGGIAVYFLYVRYKGASSTGGATGPVATVLDPNAVDPTTGLTYGQEMGGNFPVSSPGTGGLGTTADGSGLASPPTGVDPGQLPSLGIDAPFPWTPEIGQLFVSTGAPPNPSTRTRKVTRSAPLKKAHGPSTKASSHRKQKTIHVAHPRNHQHPLTPRKSHAHTVPVKHPAGGGHPGTIRKGSHRRRRH